MSVVGNASVDAQVKQEFDSGFEVDMPMKTIGKGTAILIISLLAC